MNVVFLGLSITSSWGNGHATNYRALARALLDRGHDVLFLERDQPWYAENRDFGAPFVHLYDSLDGLHGLLDDIRDADAVVIGSFVPDGVAVAELVLSAARGVVAFWDIDTPVTAEKLARGDFEYLTPELAGRFDLYLSFTGGPFLDSLGARRPRPFYCMVDEEAYAPVDVELRWDLGYLGTYSDDRQPTLEELLLEPARALPAQRFVVAGPQYPDSVRWGENVDRIEHLSPREHPSFYSAQRFTLNVTRAQMIDAGWSPSVRLFEAAACGAAIVSDWWDGLDAVLEPGREILVARDRHDVLAYLTELSDAERRAIGDRARRRVLSEHTAHHRAQELERHVADVLAVAR